MVNLAGAGIGDRRWTAEYKEVIRASRVTATRTLAEAVAAADHPVRLVQASAVGYYGDRGDEPLDEVSARGRGFLAEVVTDWERSAAPAVDAGASVAYLRTGIVLAPGGGAAAPLVRLGRLGLLGPMGTGDQWWPWITLADEVAAIIHLIERPRIVGPVNAVGPEPARQRDVAGALAAALHRPALVPTPAFALRAVMGEFASDILGSQRIVGSVLVDSGFVHVHGDLVAAATYVTGR